VEKLYLYAVDGFAGFDALFRRRLKKVIPRFQELVDNPRDYLACEEVRIGPSIKWFTGTSFGLVLGLLLSCGVLESWPRAGLRFIDKPVAEQWPAWLVLLLTPSFCIGSILYFTRGGEITLRAEGVEFRLRNATVACPWGLFCSQGLPEWLDVFTLAMPIDPKLAYKVVLQRNGEIAERGRLVRTKQFRFRSESAERVTNNDGMPEVAIRDLYRARLNEIGSLLLILSRELGDISGAPSTSGG
jgi:hypothetical protein